MLKTDSPRIIKHDLRGLLTLAWPIIVSRSTQVVVGLADALMVSHLGETALAAVTAGAMNSYAFFVFPMGVSFIVSSFSSQLTGRGQAAGARRYGWYGLIIAGLAQLLALTSIPFFPIIFSHFGYTPEVSMALCSYLAIRFLSTGAAVGIEALGNYYGGLGNTSLLMKANITAMAANVLFNWLLIDGRLGFPALGFQGAAWGSVLSVNLAFAIFLTVFLLHGRGLGRLGLDVREFLRMMRFGLPSGLNWSFEFFAFILFVNIVVAGLGTSSLAAMMAVLQLNSISFMPAFGLSSAGAILVGQSIGARQKHAVPYLVRLTFLASAAWMGLVSVSYLAFPTLLLSPFVPGQSVDGAFMATGVLMLGMSAFWQVFDAAGMTLSESLRAAGDTAYAMWARGLIAWGFFLPGSWIHVRHFGGSEGAVMAWLIAYLAIVALALYLRFKSGAWKKIELMQDPLPVLTHPES
ncbi:MAG: MATE family efflux transporter [Elusimicrobiota bacterium]